MTSGQRNDYWWIQWENVSLATLLARIPEIVLGRYLLNTSFDSGSLMLSEEEQAQGWRSVGPFTYSPRIKEVSCIPSEQFDEWLVFARHTEVQSWEAVVNYCGFSLVDRSFDWIQAKLWMQMERVRPESYLAQGDRLIFITRNRGLHELALEAKQDQKTAV